MKIAALDLGSNTFLCLICDVDHNGIQKVYSDDVEIVRLGEGLLKNKKFQAGALERAQKCLTNFKKSIDLHKPEKVLAVATSAARDAENKEELFNICKNLNIPLEIIAGEKEAAITYFGATSAHKDLKKRLVIDIGGGSTEFIFGETSKISFAESYDIGCVRLTEKFITHQPTPAEQIENCRNYINNYLKQLPMDHVDEVLAVAGTPTTLAAVELGGFDVKKIDGYEMTLQTLENWLIKLQPLSVQQKIELGFPKGRADVIIVGVITLIESLKKMNVSKIIISTRGVRYGIALKVFNRT